MQASEQELSCKVGHNVAYPHAHICIHVCIMHARFVAVLHRYSRLDKSCLAVLIDQLTLYVSAKIYISY